MRERINSRFQESAHNALLAILAAGALAGSVLASAGTKLYEPGDCNLDGVVGLNDVDAFYYGIMRTDVWQQRYGGDVPTLLRVADFSGNGAVGTEDIDGFETAVAKAVVPSLGLTTDDTAGRTPPTASIRGASRGIDLDVDSNNDDDFGIPDRGIGEDGAEDVSGLPGKIIRFEDLDSANPLRTPALASFQTDTVTCDYGRQFTWWVNFDSSRLTLYKNPTGTTTWTDYDPATQSPTQLRYHWYGGDFNGNGVVNVNDIGPFVLFLTDPGSYATSYPCVPIIEAGDFNNDGSTTIGDNGGFVATLTALLTQPLPIQFWIKPTQQRSTGLGDISVDVSATVGNTWKGSTACTPSGCSCGSPPCDAFADEVTLTVGDLGGAPRSWGAGIAVDPFSTVDLRSGNLFTKVPLADLIQLGVPLQLYLVHDTHLPTFEHRDQFSGILGPRWRLSYCGYVAGEDEDDLVIVVRDDGRVDMFTRNPSPGASGRFYDPPAGVYDDLRWDAEFEPLDYDDKKPTWSPGPAGAWLLTTPQNVKTYFRPDPTGTGDGYFRTDRVINSAGNASIIYNIPPDQDGPFNRDRIATGADCEFSLSSTDHSVEIYEKENKLIIQAAEGRFWSIYWDVNTSTLIVKEGFTSSGCGSLNKTIEFEHFVDDGGRIRTVTDTRDGLSWTYDYDSSGRVTEITDSPPATGSPFRQEFSWSGLTGTRFLATYTDRRESEWIYSFGSHGDLELLENPLSDSRTWTYDSQHNRKSFTDELAHSWTYAFGPIGNVTSVTSPFGSTQKWDFNWIAPNQTAPPSGPGELWNFYRLLKITEPARSTGATRSWVEFVYADWQGAAYAVDPTLVREIHEIDADDGLELGAAVTILDYHGLSVCNDHASRGRLSAVTDANGGKHTFDYNLFGHLAAEIGGIRPTSLLAGGTDGPENSYETNRNGWTTSADNDSPTHNSLNYAADGNLASDGCKLPTLLVNTFAYPVRQCPVPATPAPPGVIPSPEFSCLRQCGGGNVGGNFNGYDCNGRPVYWHECLNRTYESEFPSIRYESFTRTENNWAYDELRRPLSFDREMHADNGWEINDQRDYGYTGAPTQPTQITPHDQVPIKYESAPGNLGYDEFGRPKIVKRGDSANGYMSVEYTYDAAGRVTDEALGNGAAIQYQYDNANRVQWIKHFDSSQILRLWIEYTWGKDNTVSKRKEHDLTGAGEVVTDVTFTYDLRKRLTREVRAIVGGATIYDISYAYDQLGNRLTKIDAVAEQRTDYFYDVDDNNFRVVDNDPRLSYSADPWDHSYEYSTADNRLLHYVVADTGVTPPKKLRKVWHTYFKTGGVSNITLKDYDPAPVGGVEAAEYQWYRDLALYYTSSGHLWRALHDRWKVNTSGIVQNYGLAVDDSGPMPPPVEFYSHGQGARFLKAQMELVEQEEQDEGPYAWAIAPTERPFLLTDMDGLLPLNDRAIELIDDDESGVRETANSINQVRYLSDSRLLAYQTIDEQTNVTDETHYLHGDLTYSTMLRTDDSGNVVPGTGGDADVLAYTAFGEPIVQETGGPRIGGELPAGMTRYGYVGGLGYEQDMLVLAGASGSPLPPITLSHVGHRWYEPGPGRWMQRDPLSIRAGLNLSSYVLNNPVNYVDPTGLMSFGESMSVASFQMALIRMMCLNPQTIRSVYQLSDRAADYASKAVGRDARNLWQTVSHCAWEAAEFVTNRGFLHN